jgi:uncharacterized SAM-binding protein YcdF (DUF218 family)
MRLIFSPIFLLLAGLAVLAILAGRRGDRVTARSAWVLLIVGYLNSANMIVGATVGAWSVPSPPECQQSHPGATYVVLTGGASLVATEPRDVAMLSQATLRRVIAGIDMAAASPDSRLLISGGGIYVPIKEAIVARELALRLGWPAERLSIETASTDTFSSAMEVAELLRAETFGRPIVLVTSAIHMRRALFSYRNAQIDVIGCSTDAMDPVGGFIPGVIPTVGSLQRASDLWKEIAGLLVYKLRVAMRPAIV